MTSSDKETSGKSGGTTGTSKRPARTIDLEADEVEIEVKDSEGTGEEVAAEEQETAENGNGGDADKAAGRGEPETEDESRPSGLPPRTPPPQRTRPSDVRSFVTHLAAGLVGGLIGVVGVGIGLDKLPFTTFSGGAVTPEETARIEQRLDKVASKQAELAKSLEAAPKSDALTKVESRLEAIETQPAPAPAVPEEIGNRLTKLEEILKTLQSAAGEEGATALEQSAALTAKIDAVSKDLEKKTAALTDRMESISADLEKKTAALSDDIARTREILEARPAPRPAGESDAVKALQSSLAKLEERLAALAEQPVSAIPRSGSNPAALALAFENLQRTADRGEPFAAQLEALGKLAGADIDISALAASAKEGVPSEAALLGRLPRALRDARAAVERADDETFLDRLASNASSVVRVRRIGPQEGDSAAAVLSRMEARMKGSDLSGVIEEAQALEGAARGAVRPWLAEAQARRDLDAALAAARAKLLASLGDNTAAQPVR